MKKTLLLAAGTMLLLVLLAGLGLLWWLSPRGDTWQQALRFGPLTLHLSTQRTIGLLSRPAVATLFGGSTLHTAAGVWHIDVARDGVIELTCEPCLLQHRSLGPAPLHFTRVTASLARQRSDDYSGVLRLHGPTRVIALRWTGHVDSQGATFVTKATGMPMADIVAVLGQDLAEATQASISGKMSFELRVQLPSLHVDTALALDGFTVTGLGTQQLLHVRLPDNCGSPSSPPITGWLPAAVIAAEDQKFRSHPGYDLGQITAAARSNQAADALSGASTLTQQLARLLYTGGERSPQRKLRELLYAVEMEQTLGKARILQLYLALAPWGNGVCGAQLAAQRYLGKAAGKLTPSEAAWLAGLLTNPDAQLHRQAIAGTIDAERTAHILDAMRPMSNQRRRHALEDLASLRPQVLDEMRPD